MAKYRTLKAVSYVVDGKVQSVAANRTVDLTDAQAEALGADVERSLSEDAMFPGGAPIIPAGFVIEADVEPVDPKTLVSGLPAPTAKAKPAEK
jgi:hypothetical protein